jgi:diaminopimelate epimerase
MLIEFTKMTGAGNDFIVLGPQYAPLKVRGSELAKHLCPRRTAVGADGLIILESAEGDPRMHYWNSDGSEASFCGNGVRCAIRFLSEKGLAKGPVALRSKSGIHTGQVTASGAKVSMRSPTFMRKVPIEVGGEAFEIHLVDSGVPHGVVLRGGLDTVDIEVTGRSLRHHDVFGSEGANIDFVDTGGDVFQVRTYERGVEAETLACGSGCVAAALVLLRENVSGPRVSLRVASGDVLTVELASEDTRGEAFLTGPAAIVYEGQTEIKE